MIGLTRPIPNPGKKMTKAKLIKFIIATVLAIVALFVPYEALGIDGPNTLNPIEIRVIAIFVMAALYWILLPSLYNYQNRTVLHHSNTYQPWVPHMY